MTPLTTALFPMLPWAVSEELPNARDSRGRLDRGDVARHHPRESEVRGRSDVDASRRRRSRVDRSTPGRSERAEGSRAISASRPDGSDPSDQDAVAGARRGDPEAFRVLVERYQGRAYRLALRVLRDEERARDAVQDAFLKAYVNLDRFEGRSSFYTWLYRLVMNLCLDARRRDRSSRIVATPESVDLEQLGSPDSRPADEMVFREHEEGPEEALGRGQLRAALSKAIDDLPDAARETLILREVEGLSYAEIADALRIPKGTVMSRLHYARRRVQELLRQGGMVEKAAPAVPPRRGESP
jgi:RNA polymerase sigma-70 factor (ECF subfamily)